ncbi:MAG: UDP-N-acetylmuramoyl-L-alanine--D-glutamate ligase [Burkholderiales bacterium]|nr:UDP-N-acetylmuramoyl-L-alanine--D-glutamate ligase [Burkholderiales bacterium]
MELAGAKVLVLGLGDTGLSLARWAARSGAAAIRVADTRAEPPARAALAAAVPGAEAVCGVFTDALYEGIDVVAISPGVPLAEPTVARAAARGLAIAGDVELFARAVAGGGQRVIGITGTNGKSTVTALTGALLRASGADVEVAGNIGPPVLEALMRRLDTGQMPDVWVLELSSFQLETTASLACEAATVLNVTEDHLDRYAGLAEYAAAKARIFAGGGLQVLNRDDRWSMGMALSGRRVITFGLGPATEHEDFGLIRVFGKRWLARGLTPLVALDELKLAGLHNAANAMAALALAKAGGAKCAAVMPALKGFAGLPHRVERVGEARGVVFYDDSKGTNVGSTVAALAGLAGQLNGAGGKVVLIAGGEGKGQDFAPLAEAVARAAREVVLIGRDAPLIAAAVAGSGVPVERAATMEDAVARAFAAARPGDAVLLSPACASFDMFRNYVHRGEAFAAAVQVVADARPR